MTAVTPRLAPGRRVVGPSTRRLVLLALAVYAVTRLVSAFFLVGATHLQVPNGWTGPSVDYFSISQNWDGTWYRRIAEGGYPATLPRNSVGELQQNEWAFYPLFPFLVRAVMTVTGAPFMYAGGTVALLCGFAAAAWMAVMVARRTSTAVALGTVAVWGSFMASPVLQVAYTESLAVLLLVAFLDGLDTRRWWQACAAALLLGVARPIAAPLGLVALVALAALWWRARHTDPAQPDNPTPPQVPGRPDPREVRGLLAVLVCCGISALSWMGIAWAVTGERNAYLDTMATWFGGSSKRVTPWWDNAIYFLGDSWGPRLLIAGWIVALLLPLGPWARPLGPVLRAWCVAYPLYLLVVLNPQSSLFRYLLPLFPWAVIGVGARSTRLGVVVRTALLVLIEVALQAWWTRSFFVFYPPSSWPP